MRGGYEYGSSRSASLMNCYSGAMQYIRSADWERGIQALAWRLQQELKIGKPVLWLLSGGSNVAASVRIMQQLPATLSRNLSISLADERFGSPGHADSNWTKLLQAGFAPQQARLLPVLLPGIGFEETQDRYELLLRRTVQAQDCVIAQLGIGSDGHIAGILPHSPGTKDTEAMTVAYHSDRFDRISLSFAGLRQLTATYTFAFGADKKSVLARLTNETLPPTEQPAQILKQLHEAYVYNDQVGENT